MPHACGADDRRLGSLDARNPANDTEQTTKLTNRRWRDGVRRQSSYVVPVAINY
jgi:hypothetical protein